MQARSVYAAAVWALALAGMAGTAPAQVTFLPPIEVVELPNDLLLAWDAGDMDGDSLPDVIYTGFAKVGLVSNLGDGRWTPQGDLPSMATGHRLADLNGDGVLDLLAPGLTMLEVRLGLGDGSFGSPIVSTGPGAGFGSVMAGLVEDVSGDGDNDVITLTLYPFAAVSDHDVVLSWHRGKGDGSFHDPVVIDGLFQPWTSQLASGDLDADGDQDLLLYTPALFGAGVSMKSYLSDGDGNFAKVESSPALVFGRASLADVDGDGLPDLLGEAAGGHTGSVLPGLGDGTFGAPVWAYEATGPGSPRIEAQGDFDDDGALDLLRTTSNGVEVWLNAGDGTFSLAETLLTGNPWLGAFAEDLNGDGRCDVVANVNIGGVVSLVAAYNTTFTADAPFEDRGDHLVHPQHRTLQMASGGLLPGEPFAFAASDLPDAGQAWLVLGAQQHDLPFAGGSIGPSMDHVVGPVDLGGSWRWTLEGAWPAGVPSGTRLFTQFWVRDAGGSFSSTGTVEVDVP